MDKNQENALEKSRKGQEKKPFEGFSADLEAREDDVDSVEESKKGKGGCWDTFARGIRGIWATHQTEDTENDEELKAKNTLREMLIYCIFLSLLCLIIFDQPGLIRYYYTKLMTKLVTQTGSKDGRTSNFVNMNRPEDLLKYAENILIPLLYGNKHSTDKNKIYYQNNLQGVPRFRQIRIRDNSCIPPVVFRKQSTDCYARYSKGVTDRRPFGPGFGPGWTFSEAGSAVSTELNTYGTGGYHIDLNTTLETSLPVVKYLKDNLWVDRSTRAIFVDFTVYNANINLFCVIKLIAEYPPIGGIIPSFEFRTVKLIRYNTPNDMFVMACEFIFCLFILYYIGEEFLEIKKFGYNYLLEFWNVFDLIILALSLCCIFFHVYRFLVMKAMMNTLSMDPDAYIDFDSISSLHLTFNSAFSIMTLFAWIKIFKYVKVNKTMTLLSKTLGSSAKTLGEFSIMFFIVFLAFAQSGYLLFSSTVTDFNTFESSLLTLFRMTMADFNIWQFRHSHSTLGPIYFCTYVFFIYFILTNMFIAILTDTYSTLREKYAGHPTDVDLIGFIMQYLKRVVASLNRKVSADTTGHQEKESKEEKDEKPPSVLPSQETPKKMDRLEELVENVVSKLEVLVEKVNSLEGVLLSTRQLV